MNKRIYRFIRTFTAMLALFTSLLFLICILTAYFTPSRMSTEKHGNEFSFPLSVKYDKNAAVYAAFDSSANSDEKSNAKIMLFDSIPVKDVNVNVTQRKNVILGGMPFGMRIYTNGLVVSNTSNVGNKNPSFDAGIKSGDIILCVNGEEIDTNEQLLNAVEKSKGNALSIKAMHDGKEYSTKIIPVFDENSKKYRIGLMVRDSCAGIGTMTFFDKENHIFAGLGHGICDTSSGSLMPLEKGDIVNAEINFVNKSICGSPGSLSGTFTDSKPVGTITANSQMGIYGTLNENALIPQNSIPVSFTQEVKRGKAQILTTIDSEQPKLYDINIEDVSYNNNSNKNMVIKITDKELLEKTGGIVQGMSGSPIIQDNKLVGAVTHVFVNDTSRGYGIFAENMLNFCNTAAKENIAA